MTSKRILILANSTKHHPMRCVAGRAFAEDSAGSAEWKEWVRPVSNHDEGALSPRERMLQGGTDPRPLDVVQIPLLQRNLTPLQPENWLVDGDAPWTKVTAWQRSDLTPLIEHPSDLWIDRSQRSDRASDAALSQLPNFQSLYLVRPEGFYFQIRSKVWNGYSRKQIRGIFNYRGRYYDLPVTDPLIGQRYFPDFPGTAEGIINVAQPHETALCVSLTPPFEGFHYKVIATVFEL